MKSYINLYDSYYRDLDLYKSFYIIISYIDFSRNLDVNVNVYKGLVYKFIRLYLFEMNLYYSLK